MEKKPYIERVLDDELAALLVAVPAIALEGPKGVGKTASAARFAATVRRLDVPAQRSVVAADPHLSLAGPLPVLIDQWQRYPPVWDAVKRAVDDGADPGSFLLTGSATPGAAATHSGAGRIVTLRMRPLSFFERRREKATVSLAMLLAGGRPAIDGSTDVGLCDYVDEIVNSGFPAFRGLSGRPLRTHLDGYLARIVDADLEELGLRVRRPELVRRWLRAYAAATSTTAAYETIRDAATGGEGVKPSKGATAPYRDVLERLWIVDPVPAWAPSRNPLARLTHPSKHHLADPALAARYPLAMISPPARHFLNSTFVNVKSLRDIEGEPLLEIHPEDAASRGVADGSVVEVFNDRGVYRCKAAVSTRARPGVVNGLGIWWRKLGRDGTNVNELTHQRLTDLGRAPAFYDCLVQVRPA